MTWFPCLVKQLTAGNQSERGGVGRGSSRKTPRKDGSRVALLTQTFTTVVDFAGGATFLRLDDGSWVPKGDRFPANVGQRKAETSQELRTLFRTRNNFVVEPPRPGVSMSFGVSREPNPKYEARDFRSYCSCRFDDRRRTAAVSSTPKTFQSEE